MSSSRKPPTYHLRAFALSLAVILVALISVLFGVHMEAVTHGAGTIRARDFLELRCSAPGLVELGWYEGEIMCSGSLVRVRLDQGGDGQSDPAQGESRTIDKFRCWEGTMLALDQLRFHKLASGDRLWPGQTVGRIRTDDLLDRVRHLLSTPVVRAPATGSGWQVLKVCREPGQAVKQGDALAWLAPADLTPSAPGGWIAQIDIPEKQAAGIEAGQEVRLVSAMFNQRLHGHAEGVVEKVEPLAEPSDHGERRFQAQVRITQAPFPLHHGATVKAEIILGHKRVYRIILEQ